MSEERVAPRHLPSPFDCSDISRISFSARDNGPRQQPAQTRLTVGPFFVDPVARWRFEQVEQPAVLARRVRLDPLPRDKHLRGPRRQLMRRRAELCKATEPCQLAATIVQLDVGCELTFSRNYRMKWAQRRLCQLRRCRWSTLTAGRPTYHAVNVSDALKVPADVQIDATVALHIGRQAQEPGPRIDKVEADVGDPLPRKVVLEEQRQIGVARPLALARNGGRFEASQDVMQVRSACVEESVHPVSGLLRRPRDVLTHLPARDSVAEQPR